MWLNVEVMWDWGKVDGWAEINGEEKLKWIESHRRKDFIEEIAKYICFGNTDVCSIAGFTTYQPQGPISPLV